jgi:hypothetical protein
MDLSDIRRHTESAGPHVGDLLWWTLQGARIRRTDLERLWTGAGLSASLLPEPPTSDKALKTAVRDAQLGVDDHLFRLGKDSREELVFALLHEQRDEAGNVEHLQVARVRLDKNHTSQLETDNPTHELVRAVLLGYDHLLNTHTVDDVRRTLVKTLDACAAVTLREHGGVYWVPAQFSETLHRLQSAVWQIGQSRLDIVPIHATPEGTEALGHAAHDGVEAEIATLRAEISSFIETPPERASTLMRRLDRFEDLKQKAQLYHSVLSVQVQDLDLSLEELTRTVRRLLDEQAAPSAANAA